MNLSPPMPSSHQGSSSQRNAIYVALFLTCFIGQLTASQASAVNDPQRYNSTIVIQPSRVLASLPISSEVLPSQATGNDDPNRKSTPKIFLNKPEADSPSLNSTVDPDPIRTRTKRSTLYISRPDSCPSGTLLELLNSLKEIDAPASQERLKRFFEGSAAFTEDYDYNYEGYDNDEHIHDDEDGIVESNRCPQIPMIKNDLNELKKIYTILSGAKEVDVNYKSAKHDYEAQVKILKWRIYGVTRNASDKELVEMINKEFQNFLSKLTMSFHTSEMNQENLIDKYIQLCILEIGMGKIEKAVGHISKLQTDEQLEKVFRGAYEHTELDNIFKFILDLPNVDQHVIAYEVLYSEMEKNDRLRDAEVLKLNFLVAYSLGNFDRLNPTHEYKDRFVTLIDSLSAPITDVLDGIAEDIRAGRQNSVMSDFIHESHHMANFYNDNYYNKLVVSAYQNSVQNFENIMSFITHQHHWLVQHFLGYVHLHKEMERNEDLETTELLTLAYRIKASIDRPNAPAVVSESRDLFNQLFNKFPDIVRHLISDSYVSIENRKAPGYTLYIQTSGNLFIHPHEGDGSGWHQQWVPLSKKGVYFAFKNLETGNMLLTQDKNELKEKLGIFYKVDTYDVEDKEQNWIVTPVKGWSYVYLTNVKTNHVLYFGGCIDCGKTPCNRLEKCAMLHSDAVADGSTGQHWKIY